MYFSFLLKESSTVTAIRNAATSVCSLSLTEFDLRFNPDIFSPNVKHAEPEETLEAQTVQEGSEPKKDEDQAKESEKGETEKEALKSKKYPALSAQIRLNREACDYLLLLQIPTFVRDVTSNR